MSASLHRLTLFALISAMEDDLRGLIKHHLLQHLPIDALFGETIATQLRDRLSKDQDVQSTPTDHDLLYYANLSDAIDAIARNTNQLATSYAKYFKKTLESLSSVVSVRNRVMHSRPLHFDDYGRVTALAKHLGKSHSDIWKTLRLTIDRISQDPSYIPTLTIDPPEDLQTNILNNLPLPDFDDTGFIGRAAIVETTRQAILGSYPVVSIVGEGGLGKTALALKVSYDLLDDPACAFEAIVWTTAKAHKLTNIEIVRIDHAITDSVGLFAAAADVIGTDARTNPLDQLIRNLTSFKVLLIIDNLETVLDDNIRELVRRIPRGSKIVFTSRISIGAFDFPITLPPLDRKEAQHYLRVTSRVWGLEELAQLPADMIADYCRRLQHNPLFIKWFVQGVRSGQRPESILANPKLLLTFCLSNVYDHLSAEAKKIIAALVCVGGFRNQATISFLTGIDIIPVQSALSNLLSSNLIVPYNSRNKQEDQAYALSELTRLYIQNYVTPSTDEQRMYIKRRQQLVSAREEIEALQNQNPYDMDNISVRSDGDYVTARILLEAIRAIKRKDFDAAEKRAEDALRLSPHFFEAKRIEAGIAVLQKNFVKARAAYEAAISLAPDHAPLRLWYGDFLWRHLQETNSANDELEEGLRLDPGCPHLLLELARLRLFRRQFPEADAMLAQLRVTPSLPPRMQRKLADLGFQLLLRRADFEASRDDIPACLASVLAFRDEFSRTDKNLIDRRTRENAWRAWGLFPDMLRFYSGTPTLGEVVELRNWFEATLASDQYYPSNLEHQDGNHETMESVINDNVQPVNNVGTIHSVKPGFGFLECGSRRFFFGRPEFRSSAPWSDWILGRQVMFDLGTNDQGVCAVNVRLQMELDVEPGKIIGIVAHVRENYGFVKGLDGITYFLHQSQIRPPALLNATVVGRAVEFSARPVFGKAPAAHAVVFKD